MIFDHCIHSPAYILKLKSRLNFATLDSPQTQLQSEGQDGRKREEKREGERRGGKRTKGYDLMLCQRREERRWGGETLGR